MLVLATLPTMAAMCGAIVQQVSSAVYEEHIHFDANHTAATRHLSFDVNNNDANVKTIQLTAGATLDKPSLKRNPVSVMLVPDQPAGKMKLGFGPNGGGFGALVLTDACLSSCHHGATVFARLAAEPPSDAFDFKLEGTLAAFGAYDNPKKLDTQLALGNDADLAFTGIPTSRVAATHQRVRLTAANPRATSRMTVTISADALRAPLEYPLTATMTFLTTSNKLEFADQPGIGFAFDGTEVGLAGDGGPLSVDLLSRCKPAKDCEIDLAVTSQYTPRGNAVNQPSTPPGGYAEVTWQIEVRVDAFDGRPLPKDAVSITN